MASVFATVLSNANHFCVSYHFRFAWSSAHSWPSDGPVSGAFARIASYPRLEGKLSDTGAAHVPILADPHSRERCWVIFDIGFHDSLLHRDAGWLALGFSLDLVVGAILALDFSRDHSRTGDPQCHYYFPTSICMGSDMLRGWALYSSTARIIRQSITGCDYTGAFYSNCSTHDRVAGAEGRIFVGCPPSPSLNASGIQ